VLPQIIVLERDELPLFLPLPAVLLPAGHPFVHALADVFAVGQHFHKDIVARECIEAADDGHQLHAVVGRLRFIAGVLLHCAAGGMLQDVRPAAWSRVAAAGAVREEEDFWLYLVVATGHDSLR
jgi:hypothetical protein